MIKKPIIPFSIAILSILVYGNQGISSLPDQAIYYLCRENWHLNAGTIGLIGWITGLAWYCKILFGVIADKVNKTKLSLLICYTLMLGLYLFIILCGLNFYTLIITGLLINLCIAQADVVVDKVMVKTEKRLKLKGRLQSVQWTSLGIAGLIVSLFGAWIAKYFPEHTNYKVAYAIAGVIPVAMILYLLFKYKEKIIKSKPIKLSLKGLTPQFKMGLLFIVCLNFAPSFGTALMIKIRETMGVDKLFLGYLGVMGTVLGIVGYLIYYKWAYKFPMKKMLYFMVVFSAVTNLFYLHIPNQWFLVAYNLAFGAFGGVTFMFLLAYFVTIIPKGNEGLFYALITSANNFSVRGGNWVGGLVYDKLGYNWNVVIATITTLLCLTFIPLLKIKGEQNET
jgi:MFS family permease